jgi:nitrogen-specific signal transduction histidine kinase
MEKDTILKKTNDKGLTSFSDDEGDLKPLEMKEREGGDGDGNSLVSPLFIELAHRIKNTLSSIKNITQLSRGKFKDLEFEDYFHRSITEDIEKIESVINGLLNYVKVSTPVLKSNTVHSLLEEIVERHRNEIEEKKVRFFKKFEKGLPETVLHEEQLRYVFNSILQYAIAAIPPNGSIGLLTKLYDHPKTVGEKKGSSPKDERYVEILFGFTGYKKPMVSLDGGFKNTALQRDEAMDLVLRLVREIVQKNKGSMRFDIDEKKPKTFISLLFPIERRRVVYYPKANP